MRILAETLDESLSEIRQPDNMPTSKISIKSVEYKRVLLKANILNLIAENNPRDKLKIVSKLGPLENAAEQMKD